MAEKQSHTGLYIALGTLAAVGAGYLIWRYVLSDDQKERTKQAVVTTARNVRGARKDMAEELPVSR